MDGSRHTPDGAADFVAPANAAKPEQATNGGSMYLDGFEGWVPGGPGLRSLHVHDTPQRRGTEPEHSQEQ